MTQQDRDKLRALAAAVEPDVQGPWLEEHEGADEFWFGYGFIRVGPWVMGDDAYGKPVPVAPFTAATSPSVVLALLDELDALEARNAALTAGLFTLMNNVDGALMQAMCLRDDGEEEPEWTDALEHAANTARALLTSPDQAKEAE